MAALLGLSALEAEAFGPEHLLNRMSLPHLHVVCRDAVRYCPECLRAGYHSEIFQLRAVHNCPEHGVALREGCPNCRGWIVPDARTRGALTCAHCAAPLCPWSPPLDGVLTSERFPALEALGRALREHAGRRGYAQRTFVLGPRPYDAPQGALLALWTDSDPHRIRAFVPKLRRARWRGDGRAPVWPVELRPVYLAFGCPRAPYGPSWTRRPLGGGRRPVAAGGAGCTRRGLGRTNLLPHRPCSHL